MVSRFGRKQLRLSSVEGYAVEIVKIRIAGLAVRANKRDFSRGFVDLQ